MAAVITAALQLYDFSLKTAGTLGNWEEQRLFDTPRSPCSCHGSSNSWHLAKSYSSTPNRVFLNPQSLTSSIVCVLSPLNSVYFSLDCVELCIEHQETLRIIFFPHHEFTEIVVAEV